MSDETKVELGGRWKHKGDGVEIRIDRVDGGECVAYHLPSGEHTMSLGDLREFYAPVTPPIKIEPGSRWLRKSDRDAPAAFVERLVGGYVEFVNRGGFQVSLRRESFLAMYEPEPADDSPSVDPVDNPPHYKGTAVEPIDAIEAWGLGFNLGNVIKYVARAGRKGDRLEDLRKAKAYLDREIEKGATKP